MLVRASECGRDNGSVLKQIFYLLLACLGIRRLRGHSFFDTLLPRPAVVADFGAHRGEFYTALKAQRPISQALLLEADPALAETLKATFGDEVDILQAALVGRNREATIVFTRSTQAEASSIFSERVAVYGAANEVKVRAVDFSEALRHLDGRVDLAKFDIEGAEVEVLESASADDLATCNQLTIEFHDNTQPITRRDVDRVCQRMRCEGYGVVNASWPFVDDVLFVNLRWYARSKRLPLRCRMALVNTLFVLRGALFAMIRFVKGSHASSV